jgi:exodeoxyribonuclease VII small subunit
VSDQQAPMPDLDSARSLIHDGAFEETLEALEAVVAHLERGRLSIEEAVNWYEVGLGLTRRCANLLEQAELRITSLEEAFGFAAKNEDRWDFDGS